MVTSEKENFINLHLAKGTYTHIFSSITDWVDSDKLIIEVSGRADKSPDSPPDTQFYLIEAKTGKIIKKI